MTSRELSCLSVSGPEALAEHVGVVGDGGEGAVEFVGDELEGFHVLGVGGLEGVVGGAELFVGLLELLFALGEGGGHVVEGLDEGLGFLATAAVGDGLEGLALLHFFRTWARRWRGRAMRPAMNMAMRRAARRAAPTRRE